MDVSSPSSMSSVAALQKVYNNITEFFLHVESDKRFAESVQSNITFIYNQVKFKYPPNGNPKTEPFSDEKCFTGRFNLYFRNVIETSPDHKKPSNNSYMIECSNNKYFAEVSAVLYVAFYHLSGLCDTQSIVGGRCKMDPTLDQDKKYYDTYLLFYSNAFRILSDETQLDRVYNMAIKSGITFGKWHIPDW